MKAFTTLSDGISIHKGKWQSAVKTAKDKTDVYGYFNYKQKAVSRARTYKIYKYLSGRR